MPVPDPFPLPAGRGRIQFPPIIGGGGGSSGGTWTRNTGERVNPDALREVTDDTGGRTEIVRGFGDLQAATARIADELSKRYSLAYSSTEERTGAGTHPRGSARQATDRSRPPRVYGRVLSPLKA